MLSATLSASVAVTRPPHRSWGFAWIVDGPAIHPQIADEIARKFQDQFDLI